MVKKNKNRQTLESPSIQNGGDSGESGDQKKSTTDCRCQHVQKAVQLNSVKKSFKNGCLASDCPGCVKDSQKPEKEEGSQSSGLWLCLQCGHQGCGRTENHHALKHFHVLHSDPHCIAVNTTTWNVWCYNCEAELPCEYRKKLQECVKYLKNLDCPSSVAGAAKCGSTDGSKEMESSDCCPMPLTDVTNMPLGIRAPKKKMVSLPRVRGLHNLGNTCFFNSVMQCLAQTPHFLELLQDTQQGGTKFCLPGGKGLLIKPDRKKKDEEEDNEDEEEEDEELAPLEGTLTKWGTLTETLASTLEELRQDDATAVNPRRLFYKLTGKCPQFGGGGQHDAHELLRHLLDEVRTEDLKRYWVAILDQYGLSRRDTSEMVDVSVRARVRAYGRQAGDLLLLPDPVFQGILVSTVECQDCLHSYQRTEPFYDLSLPVNLNRPQPPVMRRKTGGEDSFEVSKNVTSDAPSKHQLKKERRQKRKGRKNHQQQQQPQKSAQVCDSSAGEPVIAESTRSTSESEESDADVEDNLEQESSKNGGRRTKSVFDHVLRNRGRSAYDDGMDDLCVRQEKTTFCEDKIDLCVAFKSIMPRREVAEDVEVNGSHENINEKTITEGAMEKFADTDKKGESPEKMMNVKENGEELKNCFIEESNTVGIVFNEESSQKFIRSKLVLKDRVADTCNEYGCIEDRHDKNKTITENGMFEQASNKNESLKLMDSYNNLPFAQESPQKEKDNCVSRENPDDAEWKVSVINKKMTQCQTAEKSLVEQNGSLEKPSEKTATEATLRKLQDEEEKSPKKTLNIKENGEVLGRDFIEESNTVGVIVKERFELVSLPSQKLMQSASIENGVTDKCKENGSIEDGVNESKTIVENGLHGQLSSKNETLQLSDSFNDLPSTKETPSEDLLLSVSTAINSPNVLGSPMSNTGSPSSVSSDMNVELSTSNHLPANNWSIEEADRPFSRIAFCNDNNIVNSTNNTQKYVQSAASSFNSVQKSPSTESGDKETASSEQLVKEMGALSLAHDECQSPSHWDTCSAHSLEDLKDSKLALPLEVSLCNGVGNSAKLESKDDVDKSCTLAPRYSCEDKECSIESCLNHFTMLELMTGSCKVICESCSERINKGKEGKMVATNSTKQYLVSNPPAVLVLHLKRFEMQHSMFCKTGRHVTFPMLLDIAPICNTKCRELPTIRKGQTKVLYSLYGVVQHSGSLHGGHYSAYVKVRAPVKRDDMIWCFLRNCQSSEKLEEMCKGASIPSEPLPGKWYHVSDSRVNEVNEDRVLLSQAYLLFYERVW